MKVKKVMILTTHLMELVDLELNQAQKITLCPKSLISCAKKFLWSSTPVLTVSITYPWISIAKFSTVQKKTNSYAPGKRALTMIWL